MKTVQKDLNQQVGLATDSTYKLLLDIENMDSRALQGFIAKLKKEIHQETPSNGKLLFEGIVEHARILLKHKRNEEYGYVMQAFN